MAQSIADPLVSQETEAGAKEGSATTLHSRRPLKTPLTRKGMSPQKLLEAAGILSSQALEVMDQAIEDGCGRVPAHGD